MRDNSFIGGLRWLRGKLRQIIWKPSALERAMDELVADADLFIASPDTIRQLEAKNLPVKSVFTTYEQYLDKLFKEKRKQAHELIEQLPHLHPSIANSTITALYEELKETFALGINGASIVLAILLFDISAKFRLFEEKRNKHPGTKWETIEEMQLSDVVKKLAFYEVFTQEEKTELLNFVEDVRNNYLHYNIQRLIKDMVLAQLPGVNINTGEKFIEYDVRPAEKPFLWFSAKRVLDRKTVIPQVSYCIHWVNVFLAVAAEEEHKPDRDV